nr:MAG TPA: restriction alleviation protein [Caudoviricetes sp.]
MSLPKIAPCKCGRQPELMEYNYVDIKGYYRRRYYVYCPHCGAESSSVETRTKAIKTWNYGQEGDSDAAENSRQA